MECNVRNGKIYYEIYGEGVPVLMIHGWGPDHRLMKGCMEPVFQASDKAWKRIYFDLPGMGKTKGQPWITGSDQMLELILSFIDAVIPGQRFVLAGESFGGYMARGVIHERASLVDGLLLICPASMKGTEIESGIQFQVFEKDAALLESLSKEDKELFTFDGVCAFQNIRVWERYKEEVLPGLKLTDNAFFECYFKRHQFSFDADALEPPYRKPTLILTGRQDSMVGYRGIWQIIENYPRASFVLLDKAGHGLQIDQDVLFTETVKEWLSRILAEID